MSGPLQTRKQAIEQWIYRFVVVTPPPSGSAWNFQPLGYLRGIATACAALAIMNGYALYGALLRRFTVMAAQGDDLVMVARERGRRQRGKQAAQLPLVFRPRTERVTALNGARTHIEVELSTGFIAGNSLRIRNIDGTVTEVATIGSISVATGPNGFDEIVVPALANAYIPVLTADDVQVLRRITIAEGTTVDTRAGVQFATLQTIVTGDANPVFAGESTALALADKVMAEATTAGPEGNVPPLNVTRPTTPIAGLVGVINPEGGRGGEAKESDLQLKRRTMQGPAEAKLETRDWIETMLRRSDEDIERLIPAVSTSVGVMAVQVLHRNGGLFGVAELASMKAYVEARVRSMLTLDVTNITLTSVEVEAVITLTPQATLRQVLTLMADRLVTHQALDYRKADAGVAVDDSLLLSLARSTKGVQTLDSASFLPAAPVTVAADSLPRLTRLSLKDSVTGETINTVVSVSF